MCFLLPRNYHDTIIFTISLRDSSLFNNIEEVALFLIARDLGNIRGLFVEMETEGKGVVQYDTVFVHLVARLSLEPIKQVF